MSLKLRVCVPAFVVLAMTVTACGTGARSNTSLDEVVVGHQPGLGALYLEMMEDAGLLEEQFPDVNIKLRELASGAAIRSGMIAGDIDIGVVGVQPFLVGWDKNVDWNIISSGMHMDLWLMCTDPNIKSVSDVTSDMRIAAPSVTSTNVLYQMVALEQAGLDPHSLDENIVGMGHGDAVRALAGGQVDCHIPAPPFMFLEEDDAHAVFKGNDLFEEMVSVHVAVATKDFADQQPEFLEGWYEATDEAMKLIYDDPEKAGEIYAEMVGDPDVAPDVIEWLKRDDVLLYDVNLAGVLEIAEWMKKFEQISKVPESMEEITLPVAAGGS